MAVYKTLARCRFTQLTVALLLYLLAPGLTVGDEPSKLAHVPPKCVGVLYRAKRDGVVVYRAPDLSSEILTRLNLGDRVCTIGEKAQFAILQWTSSEGTDKPETAFARLVDLWPPRESATSTGLLDKARSIINYMRNGGVADTGYLPTENTSSPKPALSNCDPDSTATCSKDVPAPAPADSEQSGNSVK